MSGLESRAPHRGVPLAQHTIQLRGEVRHVLQRRRPLGGQLLQLRLQLIHLLLRGGAPRAGRQMLRQLMTRSASSRASPW